MWGNTNGDPQPGGFLSNLDSQQLLTYDNLTDIGAFNDNDMLECCNGGQSVGEYRSVVFSNDYASSFHYAQVRHINCNSVHHELLGASHVYHVSLLLLNVAATATASSKLSQL